MSQGSTSDWVLQPLGMINNRLAPNLGVVPSVLDPLLITSVVTHADVHPGSFPISQLHFLSVVEAAIGLQTIQLHQLPVSNLVELSFDGILPTLVDRRKEAQGSHLEDPRTGPRCSQEGGPTQVGSVVSKAFLEAAVNEDLDAHVSYLHFRGGTLLGRFRIRSVR